MMNVFIAKPKNKIIPIGVLVFHESTNAPLLIAETPLSKTILKSYSNGIRFYAQNPISCKRDELICKANDPDSFLDIGAKYYALADIEISRLKDCVIDSKQIIIEGTSYLLTEL